eukprot:scaffold160_cov333-Pavlova_lutheri.AAC.1
MIVPRYSQLTNTVWEGIRLVDPCAARRGGVECMGHVGTASTEWICSSGGSEKVWERRGWTLVDVLEPWTEERDRMDTATRDTVGTPALAIGTWCWVVRLLVRLAGSCQALKDGGS